jgi:hypothetical protein
MAELVQISKHTPDTVPDTVGKWAIHTANKARNTEE